MGKLRRIALVALLAIVSSAILPYAHGATGHVGDCGVCLVLTHSGAHDADTVSAPELPLARACVAPDDLASLPLARPQDFDPRCARAPPSAVFPA